ncbi:hypothetical protein FN846DRAFT_788131 [Sphaerosporella brunnea]|uniref:Endoplasmic reticulum protein n=1 Tax=Sphaerosporella brunnea TaxID=1250544 RepID=A0A5J5ECK7_9PEZI|nr:hypothetical protein FN846DRAFT_788131 [Sphaerosporella brunnea]
MAPPNTAAPPSELPLSVRLTNLAQTLQFAWFVGHLTLLVCTLRYSLSIAKFSSGSTGATIAYRLAFLSAAATYGIVVYKAYRARFRSGTMPTGQQGIIKILGDENVQYLLMAFAWLYAKPVFFALFPFAVYSTFHFLTYLRTNVIPTIMPTAPGAPQPAVAETIARFVKKNYDASMHLVANLELFLWARVFLYCLVFQNSWILLAIYTIFLRARYAQSVFVRDALKGIEQRVDALMTDARVPDGVKTTWTIGKQVVKRFGEVSDVSKFLGGAAAAPAAKKD